MGPRSGSPATETRARAVFRAFAGTRGAAAALFLLTLGWTLPLRAASVETSHQVTVIVIPPSLSLKDDVQEGSSLTFEDPKTGAKSNARRINYRVGGNAFSTGALPGIVSAKVESPAPEIQLKADVGEFTKQLGFRLEHRHAAVNDDVAIARERQSVLRN